ncbi:hypothetical protein KIN20_019977 [Parelaphostrongylus tenuis]|uniref:C2H2-type domain-containing protein n=1 Tax=Parelaphostrongylus tenuis TaxID=148309 RepID=A0AAD5QT83_PARTN|nr:hypothetical protein KIN20_019977 [Parelaphostrongylus tenuis]
MDEDVDENDLVVCGAFLLNKLPTNLSSSEEKAKLSFGDSPIISIREKGPGSAPKQCQLCGRWITAKNARAHVATHLAIRRLRCTVCNQGFDRMNRASVHLKRFHSGHRTAKIESAMNDEQRKELDMLAQKCFPRKNRFAQSDEMN